MADAEPAGTLLSVFWDVCWYVPSTLVSSVGHWAWCLWDGVFGSGSMDTVSTLLVGWLCSAILILTLVKFLYDRYLRSDDEEPIAREETTSPAQADDVSAKETLQKKKKNLQEERRAPTIVPTKDKIPQGSAAIVAGQDADAVRWINAVLRWLYRGPHGAIAKPYLTLLNDLTTQTALETGVLVEVLEVLPATPSPRLSNLVIDCAPDDAMNLTCDCDGEVYLRLQTTRTHRDVTTESEYAAVVSPLRGRLNVAILPHVCRGVLKFDGWPEVGMELEGIRNNEEGLGEKELQEVIKEVVIAAIRNMVLEVDLSKEPDFPPFKRPRELPEKVVPVGYDSMVREQQTHPPVLKPKVTPLKPQDIPSVSLGESSFLPKDLGYPEIPSLHNLLTQNDSPVLARREERLITKNVTSFDRSFPYSNRNSDAIEFAGEDFEFKKTPPTNQSDYVPPNFLEQVKAVALAKVEEKTLSDSFNHLPSLSEEPRRDSALVPYDYITYDSEYEDEDEDFDDYLDGGPAGKGSSRSKSRVKPENVPPTERDVKAMVTKMSDVLSKPALDPLPKNLDAIPMSTASAPLGAMGLPHHPKSHFVPSFTSAPPPVGIAALNGKRLLVKIVKATNIGSNKESVNAYVIVEMDEPNQKFTTATIRETDQPFWDEQFMFDLSDMTLELLFEIYDEFDNSFLGLGIVGIEELVATPSQRQIIPLQARPYEDDLVSGTLTVEFLFLDAGNLPDLTLRSSTVQHSMSPAGDPVKTTTTTTYSKLPLANEAVMNGHDSVTSTALRGLENSTGAQHTVSSTAKSTVIIHASKKVSRLPTGQYSEREDSFSQAEDEDDLQQQTEDGADSDDNYVVNTLQYPFPSTAPATATASPAAAPAAHPSPATVAPQYGSPSDPADGGDEATEIDDDDRGRSRNKRKKSFFGSLKKRFSRSKARSQSMEPSSQLSKRDQSPMNDMPRTATVGRSVSMERSGRVRPTGLLSVPRRDVKDADTKAPAGDTGSTRSSVSETSGMSGSSTRTYVNEASMLIIETVENGVQKHYLVPVSLQQRNRWRKRGTKLHVFCGHTFVAKHVSSSQQCAVCQRNFSRRPGKQGYQCRDCALTTHKPCHVCTEVQCPSSSVNDMDLEYIRDPREERRLKNQKL